MRKLTAFIGLQAYALALAGVQSVAGLRTDEAKYLLNIPYPHPPLLRWAMSLTETVPFQEMLWRVIWATLFIQAVWLVWDMARSLPTASRLALSGGWLLSAGVILWAGSIMLAPVNALQGLVLVWLLSRPLLVSRYSFLIGLYWIAMLFSGFQAVLYLPLAATIFWKVRRSFVDVIIYAFLPVGLLAFWALSNPFAMASILHHGGAEAVAPLSSKFHHTIRLWLIAGSGVMSLAGVAGMVMARRWEILLSFGLVTLFVFMNWFEYYSVLFTPTLIMGTCLFLEWKPRSVRWFLLSMIPCAVLALALFPPSFTRSPARAVMRALDGAGVHGTVLINGAFGHQWQYESTNAIKRYRPDLVDDAVAVVCLEPCQLPSPWVRQTGWAVETWMKR